MLESVLRRLPLSDYWKTRVWARGRRRIPRGSGLDVSYYRAVELALRGVSSGYGVRFPPAERYSPLEFGVSAGQSLQALLHFRDVLARTLSLEVPVEVVGFDTFEGLPAEREGDKGPWQPGDFSASRDRVEHALRGFTGWRLVEGLIRDTLPEERAYLASAPPVFVSIDVDYYSSTVDVFEHLLDLLPNGCLFYFDDPAAHWWSDRAGELRAVRETNEGRFGPAFSFAEYPLWIETGEIRHYRQLWRFVNLEKIVAGPAAPNVPPERRRISPL